MSTPGTHRNRDTIVSARMSAGGGGAARKRGFCGVRALRGMDLAVVGRIALMLAVATSLPACLITRTEEVRVPAAVTPPRIQDEQGRTSPRLGALLEVDETDRTTVDFRVPVEDDNVDDLLQWRFFVNDDRDCVPLDGGTNCDPVDQPTPRELVSNGERVREIRETVPVPHVGCNRVELYVSSRLRLSGNYRTPAIEGDIDFRTWWIFVRARGGAVPAGDGGVVDPIESCPFRVQP